MLAFALLGPFKEEARNSCGGCGERPLKAVTGEEVGEWGLGGGVWVIGGSEGQERKGKEGGGDCRGLRRPAPSTRLVQDAFSKIGLL